MALDFVTNQEIIVAAVAGRAEIVLDGGIMRGSDALKAVALGAKAVAIGKLQGWGLAAAGQAGLVRVLELLENEITTAMGLLGVTRLDQLSAAHLSKVQTMAPTHEMSAFPHMPGGHLLRGRESRFNRRDHRLVKYYLSW